MGDVGESLRHQLLAGVTDDVAQPLVYLQPMAIRSDAGNTDSGILEDGPEPRLTIADRLDALLTLTQTLHLIVKPPAEFPAHRFIRVPHERFDKRLVLAQHRFQIRLELQFGMNLRPEMRRADECQKEHQLFVALWAEQSAQRL